MCGPPQSKSHPKLIRGSHFRPEHQIGLFTPGTSFSLPSFQLDFARFQRSDDLDTDTLLLEALLESLTAQETGAIQSIVHLYRLFHTLCERPSAQTCSIN